jgi:hypothetical protein
MSFLAPFCATLVVLFSRKSCLRSRGAWAAFKLSPENICSVQPYALYKDMEDYHDIRRKELAQLSKEKLIGIVEDAAKNWLAHDGLWFLAVEADHGLETAIKHDATAWERYTVIEAKRIMKRHGIASGSGLEGLKKALKYRLYAYLNIQEIVEETENSFVFRMNDCRVQSARKRDNRPDFPCKPVGLVEYAKFAETIDPRIKTECICCPPDKHPESFYCAWKFSI